jgi:hypothetical protein
MQQAGHSCPRPPQVNDPAVEGGLTCAEFHPDGLILGTGTADALVRIWEVRQQKARPGPLTGVGPAPCLLRATPPDTLHTCVTCALVTVGSGRFRVDMCYRTWCSTRNPALARIAACRCEGPSSCRPLAATPQQRVDARAASAPRGLTGRRARAERGPVRGPQGPGDGAVVLGERLLPGHRRRQRHQALGARLDAACSAVWARAARRAAPGHAARSPGAARAGPEQELLHAEELPRDGPGGVALAPVKALTLPCPRVAQDLRKLKNFRTLDLAAGAAGAAVAFDRSGLFLAAGGADVTVAGVKQDWATLAQFADLPKKARARAGLHPHPSAGALAAGYKAGLGLAFGRHARDGGPACTAPRLSCMHLAGRADHAAMARTKCGRSWGGALRPQRARPGCTC